MITATVYVILDGVLYVLALIRVRPLLAGRMAWQGTWHVAGSSIASFAAMITVERAVHIARPGDVST